MLEIVISRTGGSVKFPQVAKFQGEILGKGKAPIFNAARKLIEMGYDPEQTVCARWENSQTISMSGKLADYAKVSIYENEKHGPRFIKYRPFDADL